MEYSDTSRSISKITTLIKFSVNIVRKDISTFTANLQKWFQLKRVDQQHNHTVDLDIIIYG